MISLSFSIYDLEYFLLILTRVSCFIFVCPFFSMTGTPRNVRVALSVFISLMLYQLLTPAQAVTADSVVGYAVIVIKEAIAGLLVGLSANMCLSIFNFAGHVADMEVGLSMVQVLDPNTNQQSSITGGIYNYAFTMILIGSGMYRYLLGALADTFRLIPVGGAVFHGDLLLNAMVGFLSDYVLIGFRIILPIFAAALMLNAILGIIAKVSPQMNMFAIGIQLKIITGLGILFLTVSLLPAASDMIFAEMKKMMAAFVEAMM
ncbi:MAG: flagellar biosynthetic protein FliR [Lachnospiraceae bacterium]|nr:flagellar biosynthetic protein FliR [Lachnospiraceae bacterium]